MALWQVSGLQHEVMQILQMIQELQTGCVQVMQLAKDLGLAELLDQAEQAVVAGPWEGANGQDLQDMLGTLSLERIRTLTHHPKRKAASELEVRAASLPGFPGLAATQQIFRSCEGGGRPSCHFSPGAEGTCLNGGLQGVTSCLCMSM